MTVVAGDCSIELAAEAGFTVYAALCIQGWRQEFSDGGLTLPTRGLKYSFQGTIKIPKISEKIAFHLPTGG